MARIISLFSPKGGVGKTFIAANLAAILAQTLNDKKILLLDFDLELPGDSAMLLDLKPGRSLVDLYPTWEEGKYSPTYLNDFIIHHASTGLDFAPFILTKPEKLLALSDENFLSQIIKDLSCEYDYIITDTGRAYSKPLFSFFGKTNLILLIVNPDILSVYKAKEAINILQSCYLPLNMMKIILNRAESLGGVGWQEVMAALPAEILVRIPSEGRIVGSALNRRVPLVVDNRRCRVCLALDKLVETLLAHPEFFISSQELGSFNVSALPKSLLEPDSSALGQPAAKLPSSSGASGSGVRSRQDDFDKLKLKVHKRIIGELELKRLYKVGTDLSKDQELRQKTMVAISNALSEETGAMVSSTEERQRLIKEIADEVLGLGPLEDLINNPDISDIMVNNKNHIYIEKKGRLEFTDKTFVSDEQIRRVIERIIAPLGRRLDESVPMVDARLPDGSRVNAIIPPLSLTGPTLTIRKFFGERLEVSDLIKLDTLNADMGEFIKLCVLTRKNIIVSGGTGAGKTTILNLLSEYVPDTERVITIEDAAELKLHHQHWIRLESRSANIEGKGAITMRDLFRNSLRMRPDRVIIGECRGVETLDMLQSMNTGHDGSMTTLHANSTQDVIGRMDSMILMAGIELPLRAIREMIASAIDLIVHTARLSDGSRKITQITEVTGMLDELHIGLKDIFMYKQTGLDEHKKVLGYFNPTGVVPTFYEEFLEHGFKISKDIFFKKPQ